MPCPSLRGDPAACNDEQRSQRTAQSCNRVRRGLIRRVRTQQGEKRIRDKTSMKASSGQLAGFRTIRGLPDQHPSFTRAGTDPFESGPLPLP
jgi:hypothetical protein